MKMINISHLHSQHALALCAHTMLCIEIYACRAVMCGEIASKYGEKERKICLLWY
jgi:hypothetical protein